MHWQAFTILIATALTAAGPTQEVPLKKDVDKIQGTWRVVRLEADGEPAPEEIVTALKLVFKDDALTFTPGEPGFTNYTFKLDPTARPPGFDMTHADGENKGVLQHLIEGGDLTRFGLYNAVTRDSADIESYDRATEIERAGAAVVELGKAEWKSLLDQSVKS